MEALTPFETSPELVLSGPPAAAFPVDESEQGASFGSCLRQLRLGLAGKQAWLSHAVGCSDAAISFWETGARLPTPRRMSILLGVLAAAGVSTFDLLALRQRWQFERTNRGLTMSQFVAVADPALSG